MSETLTPEATSVRCEHCGEKCPNKPIEFDNKNFCCHGCASVYELTKGNNSIETGYLADPGLREQLVKYEDEDLTVVNLTIPGIHCTSCVYVLEHLPQQDQSILKSEVNFLNKEVAITFKRHETTFDQLIEKLAGLGYPPELRIKKEAPDAPKKTNLTTKIAVAGFCFGNAMLLSMPEYLDGKLLLTEDFKLVFGWINLVLGLPILFYSGRDYFTKAWKGIRSRNLNIDLPIALGMLTLFIRSVFEITTQTGIGYIDSLTGLIFFLLLGKWYQNKTYNALSFERDYSSYFPVHVVVLEDNKELKKPLKELKIGDKVLIHNDEIIPADGRLIHGKAHLDYSFVTGESLPVPKSEGEKVFAGGRQKGSPLTIELSTSVSSSELTKLWNSEVFNKKPSELHTLVDKISGYFTLIIVSIALLTGLYWWYMEPEIIWNSVTAVLIVACPCALALVLPFAYGHGMRIFGRNGLYLKNAEVMEKLAEIRSIVFDKTGTLTSNDQEIEFVGPELNDMELGLLKTAVANSSHPLSRRINEELEGIAKSELVDFEELTGKGFIAKVGDQYIKVGSAEFLGRSTTDNGGSEVHVWIDGYKGYFKIGSHYRTGIFEALKKLKNRFKLALLSGDNEGERERLGPYFHELAFNQKPQSKLDFVGKSSHALMIGDGLNDAGALKQAHVGIAVAEDIHQFSPACDAILSADRIAEMDKTLIFSARVKKMVFLAFGLSFLYNIVGLSFAVTGNLSPIVSAILMPISSVTVVGFVTLAVNWAWSRTTD